MDLVQIQAFAASAHGDQRYGDAPYTVHLAAVVAVLQEAGVVDPVLLAAGWLHDVLEDTATPRAAVAALAGEAVAAVVDALSDGPGASRAERKQRPYALIPQTPGAVLVKLADRIANVEAAAQGQRAHHLQMYRREQALFREKLWRAGEGEVLWARLERALLGAASPEEPPLR